MGHSGWMSYAGRLDASKCQKVDDSFVEQDVVESKLDPLKSIGPGASE